MTEQLSREDVQAFINQVESDVANGWEAQLFELKLAKQVLASMETEPVAWRWNYVGTTTWRLLDKKPMPGTNPNWPRVIEPLYAAPPAPVAVPDCFQRHAVEECTAMLKAGPVTAATVPDGWKLVPVEPTEAMLDAAYSHPASTEDRMRKQYVSMLAAAPAAPTGWIKCSERMPEYGGRYWCYVEEQNSLGKSHYQWNCSWNGDEWSDKALTGRVTHWMPLPAAPEQEV